MQSKPKNDDAGTTVRIEPDVTIKLRQLADDARQSMTAYANSLVERAHANRFGEDDS